MLKIQAFLVVLILTTALSAFAQEQQFEKDIIPTSAGDLVITFLRHATLMFTFNDLVIHVDPWSRAADYSQLPKADIALLTHAHGDHLDPNALRQVLREDSSYTETNSTLLIYTKLCAERFPSGVVMRNGMTWNVKGITVEAVPAYCLIPRDHPSSQPHARWECNGYILTFGDKRVYIASETENIEELKDIRDIDIAFLAMDAIFNLTPEEAIGAVNVFKPKVIYPYHYADADLTPFIEAFKDNPEIEVRIRNMP
ncbi:MBL fold metallo-hydrolase [Candidatus Latescibacterota bacterium]